MALHSFSTRPLVLQLRDALAERIATGQWKPGTSIPNEIDLARQFGVTVATMRKALDLLEDEHLIAHRQDRGTFVNDPTTDDLVNHFSKVCGSEGKPLVGRAETTSLTEGKANKAECLRLQLDERDPVWRISRTRSYDDQVFMREDVSLPAKLFPSMDDGASYRIVVLAQQHGVLLGAAQQCMSIGAASREAAEDLDIVQGSPVIVLDRIVHTNQGQPAEWRVGQCRIAGSYYLASMR